MVVQFIEIYFTIRSIELAAGWFSCVKVDKIINIYVAVIFGCSGRGGRRHAGAAPGQYLVDSSSRYFRALRPLCMFFEDGKISAKA